MGKNAKDEVPNPNSIANRDIIQRLNFLYQASVYLNGIGTSSASSIPPGLSSRKRKRKQRVLTTADLAKGYVKNMKVVGQKTMVKMDPTVKRTLCKGCDTILVAGSTATVRIKSSPSHGHAVTYTCISCSTSRRIPAPPTFLPPTDEGAPTSRDPSSAGVSTGLHQLPSAERASSKRKGTKPSTPRLPPLFARDVGHVVFRGDEKLPPEKS